MFSLFLGLFQPILALNETTMVFFKFFPIFLEFSIKRQVGTEWNRTIIFTFSLFQPIPINYGLKWSHNGIVWYFDFFSSFFGIFYYLSGKNGTERQFLFFLFLGLFQPILAWNEAIMEFFTLLNFLAIFFNLLLRVRSERNETIIFIFSLCAFSNLFWLEMTP